MNLVIIGDDVSQAGGWQAGMKFGFRAEIGLD
jgi:hypothetical protein